MTKKTQILSGPVLRDTARLSQRYPPIARYGVFGVSTWPIGCDTPSPFSERFPLGEHSEWRCDTPPSKRYLSDTCAIPFENKAKACDTPLCDTISKGYCAIWGVSRTGPLSSDLRSSRSNRPGEGRENLDKNQRKVAPCAVKTCAVRPVFARVVGELRAVDPSNVQGPVKQNASPGNNLSI